MALNLASPGILVREVDLTIGRIDGSTGKIGGIVGPFEKGPVGDPVTITGENEYVDQFGRPFETDKHYETWMVGSSYLSYGGVLSVIRADDSGLKNGFSGTASNVKIKSTDHYKELGYDENAISDVDVVGRNPGTWTNDIRVAIIDAKADQLLNFDVAAFNASISGAGTTTVRVGAAVTQKVPSLTIQQVGAGLTEYLDGHFKGIVTKVNSTNVEVKFLSHVSAAGTEFAKDFDSTFKFRASTGAGSSEGGLTFVGINTLSAAVSIGTTVNNISVQDWFDQQTLAISTATSGGTTTLSTVKWNTVADKPGTSNYAAARGSRFDEVHVVVIDAKGTVTGNAGTILEKHLSLSKAKDAEFSVGSPSYWRKYLYNNSEYIFGGTGAGIGTVATGFEPATTATTFGDGGWDQDAEGIIFNSAGKKDLVLAGGLNYGGKTDLTTTGALDSGLDDLISGYGQFENDTTVDVDFLLMGSGKYGQDSTRALAEKLITVAELRKDAVAFISPSRDRILSDTSDQTAVTVYSDSAITDNVVEFYDTISSTTFAVFDSGYKYMYDRFNNTFRYIPLNGDIAGACARTDINDFPWFSPAGTDRGAILNAVKLPYNPTRLQRDKLYSNRINPVIFSPGAGIVLFGDKTGFAKASAFDRINVRRLFIYLEDGISAAAKDQLFEFNDEITRANFVNIVEPFLRDVQSKRGIQDYVVICDETNNTAAVIDNNEFIADIFVKPARSINFIGLTFIATRTGVSFEEVIGSV